MAVTPAGGGRQPPERPPASGDIIRGRVCDATPERSNAPGAVDGLGGLTPPARRAPPTSLTAPGRGRRRGRPAATPPPAPAGRRACTAASAPTPSRTAGSPAGRS